MPGHGCPVPRPLSTCRSATFSIPITIARDEVNLCSCWTPSDAATSTKTSKQLYSVLSWASTVANGWGRRVVLVPWKVVGGSGINGKLCTKCSAKSFGCSSLFCAVPCYCYTLERVGRGNGVWLWRRVRSRVIDIEALRQKPCLLSLIFFKHKEPFANLSQY